MDDGTSIVDPKSCKVPPCCIQPTKSANIIYTKINLNEKSRCYFCSFFGEIVSDFPRRGYG